MSRLHTLIAMTAVLALAAIALPAYAAGPGAGVVHFQGIADENDGDCTGDPNDGNHLGDTPDDGKDGACLPAFPDPNGDNGDFDGDAAGSASGTDAGGEAWSVTFTGRMDADFAYAENPLECPLTGTASGTFEIGNGTAEGTYDGDAITNARAEGVFEWSRTGTEAVITFTVDVYVSVGTTEHQVLDNAAGSAVASFEASPNAAMCPDPPQRATATVVGDGEFAST